jgi:hypothetical protein
VEEWIILERDFSTREKAIQAAGIIQITESRLSSIPKGPQYDIEIEIFETEERWRVKWRKIFAGINSGCSKCNSCNESQIPLKKGNKTGKLIEFKRKRQETE